jgi:hypothetical protein
MKRFFSAFLLAILIVLAACSFAFSSEKLDVMVMVYDFNGGLQTDERYLEIVNKAIVDVLVSSEIFEEVVLLNNADIGMNEGILVGDHFRMGKQIGCRECW